jgi:hypothetical protein
MLVAGDADITIKKDQVVGSISSVVQVADDPQSGDNIVDVTELKHQISLPA